MFEVKPITHKGAFVQPAQAASAVSKVAQHQVNPATMVTISAAAAALWARNGAKATKDQDKEDPRKSFRKKLEQVLARVLNDNREPDAPDGREGSAHER